VHAALAVPEGRSSGTKGSRSIDGEDHGSLALQTGTAASFPPLRLTERSVVPFASMATSMVSCCGPSGTSQLNSDTVSAVVGECTH
jgi:hypothetical protein